MERVSMNRGRVAVGGAGERQKAPENGSGSEAGGKRGGGRSSTGGGGGAGGGGGGGGVRDSRNLKRGSPPRVPGETELLAPKENESSLAKRLEQFDVPVTPVIDGVQFARTKLASPSAMSARTGSRRTGKRTSTGSR